MFSKILCDLYLGRAETDMHVEGGNIWRDENKSSEMLGNQSSEMLVGCSRGWGEIISDYNFICSCVFCFRAIVSHGSDDQENTHVIKRNVCKGAVYLSALPRWKTQGSGMEKGGVSSHDGRGALCPPEGASCTRHKAWSGP